MESESSKATPSTNAGPAARVVSYIHQIVDYVKAAQAIAKQHGFANLLQPGLLKEMVVADLLGHDVHKTKHAADAYDPKDPSIQYEYLTCFEKGTFQLDRMFKAPLDKRTKSLNRIKRNRAIYCAVFEVENPLTVSVIYEVATETMLVEAERILDASSNDISHMGFSPAWAKSHGKLVYSKANCPIVPGPTSST